MLTRIIVSKQSGNKAKNACAMTSVTPRDFSGCGQPGSFNMGERKVLNVSLCLLASLRLLTS